MPVDPTQSAEAALRSSAAPDLPANDPFVYVHYSDDPTSWEAVEAGLDGPCWLPVLRVLPLRPGVVGTRGRGRGESIEDTLMTTRDTIRRRGGQWLDWPSDNDPRFRVDAPEHLPDGHAPGAYIRLTKTRNGGDHYHPVWAEPRPALRGRQPTTAWHAEPYNRWRHHLVVARHIQPPSDVLIADIASQAERRLALTRQDSRTDPADIRDGRMTKAQARVDLVRRAAIPTAPPPKRASSRSRSSD